MDSNKTIIRVFPTKTSATPNDDLVRIHTTPSLFDEADEVHISVTFTWDIPWAEWAAKQWGAVAPVKVGGPAYNEPGGEFVPGMYMKKGYVITSRGCPNRCWFCTVPKREGGKLRELPVTDGWIVTDDNPAMVRVKEFCILYRIVDVTMRMLRIPEMKRIQGFGDDYVPVGTAEEQKKYLGNAVVTQVATAWSEAVAAALERTETSRTAA